MYRRDEIIEQQERRMLHYVEDHNAFHTEIFKAIHDDLRWIDWEPILFLSQEIIDLRKNLQELTDYIKTKDELGC